jgi:Protein of unknown function (DUF2946)
MSSRVLRQLASWIALVAIVAVTFMPAITQLAASGTDRVDVCSADVSRGSGSGGIGHHVLDHCPYCVLHADLAMLPNPPVDGGRRLLGFSEFPAAFLQAPRANLAWSASQARAPPRLA